MQALAAVNCHLANQVPSDVSGLGPVNHLDTETAISGRKRLAPPYLFNNLAHKMAENAA